MSPCKTCKHRFGCTIASDKEDIESCDFYDGDVNSLPKQIDWEQRRYEIAKDVAASLAQRPNSMYNNVINSAIKIADELIKRLKEG